MKTIVSLMAMLLMGAVLLQADVSDYLDRFHKAGEVTTPDGRYTIRKLNPEAGILHVDYHDRKRLVETKLAPMLEAMSQKARENYLKTLPDGGYISVYIPRPEITQTEERRFYYEVRSMEGDRFSGGKNSITVDERDSIGTASGRWMPVQTIAIPVPVREGLVIEVMGEFCDEMQQFEITPN
jgi:hypothetical protein